MTYNPFFFLGVPFIPPNCDKPPTVYSILNSIVNGEKENEDEYEKIVDLPKLARTTIFNFDYPLSEKVSRETFEVNILNHYLMRRIGFETVTAFRISLNSKLNEIMPLYNKMFDSFVDLNIFEGDSSKRYGTEKRINTQSGKTTNELENISNTNSKNISDRRHSDTPQNKLSNVQDGTYLSDYNYDTDTAESKDTSTSNGTSTSNVNSNDLNNYSETIKRDVANKIDVLNQMQENVRSIYTLIYQDLDCLFYGLE